MYVSTEVLVLVVLGLALLCLALVREFRAEARLKEALAERDRPVYSYAVFDDGTPEPPPHEHLWSEHPTGFKKGFGVYPCTVPGCRAEPKQTATRRRA